MTKLATFAAFCLLALPSMAADLEAPANCLQCKVWNEPVAPYRIHGNSYYVGTKALSAVLVTGPEGHVLIDGALPQSAALIRRNIESLGYKLHDVKLILNSHAHFDHAGGIAALQRDTGAEVAASPWSAKVLRSGKLAPDDPQYEAARPMRFPAVPKVRELRDQEVVRVGSTALQALFTPGHTPGGTTWTWRSCEGAACVDIVYADSLSPVSAPRFRFFGSRVTGFRFAIERVYALPCDILLTPHPEASHGRGKGACRSYADGALNALEERLEKQNLGR